MKAALIGMMQSGKSTLMSAVSGKKMPPAGSAKIDEAITPVPDDRIDWLDTLYKPKKKIYASVDCWDLPGFSFMDESLRTAARRYLNDIRIADMLVLVVRAFEDDTVPCYRNRVDPLSDLSELINELLLADLEMASNRVERLEKQVMRAAKTLDKDKQELKLQKKILEVLEEGKPVKNAISSPGEEALIRSIGFFTMKPISVVFNTSEDQINQTFDLGRVLEEEVPSVCLCAKLEQELISLDEESRIEFMNELGLKTPGSHKFINACYSAMGLISFFTVGSDEVRAWTIKEGTPALDAAGKIHSDMKRGFIRAETMSYTDLKELGEEKAVKAAGKARLEGKTYQVQDGDVISFRFNV